MVRPDVAVPFNVSDPPTAALVGAVNVMVWDFFAISTYLTGSVLFLYLPMIPDFALVRDRASGWRRRADGISSCRK